ncbi:MAG TPA: glycosyltransferase family 2 protein [Chloroflexota bacterium]|nr:glycosyltransferase family 2 protein [Chloroflexota bacterium]
MSRTEAEPADRPVVSVIIANYNAREMLARCLASLQRHAPERSFEVLVVDDGSTDGSDRMVRSSFPDVLLLANSQNFGQSYSSNRAAREARGAYLYFANNDVELFPQTVDALASFLDDHPESAAAGSLLLNPDGSFQGGAKPLPSARTALFGRRSYITKWFPGNRFSRGEILDWRATSGEPFRVEFVHGTSVMIRRDAFFAAGGFDERLFNFGDADLCRRLQGQGHVYCVPASRVVHYEHSGGSGHNFRQRCWRVWRFHQDVWRYYRKHHSRGLLDPLAPIVAGLLAARCLVSYAIQGALEVERLRRSRSRHARRDDAEIGRVLQEPELP